MSSIQSYTFSNANIKVKTINIGAVIASILVKDQDGHWQDIALGYDDLERYRHDNDQALGAVHALLTNRIRNAQFTFQGQTYHLPDNCGGHALHTGNLRYLT